MDYNNLYNEFLKCFPEDAEMMNSKAEELDIEASDGMHVVFGMVVVPFVLKLIEKKSVDKLKSAFKFFEKMATAEDSLICEVLEFTILEDIISHDKDALNYCAAYMGSETLKSCQVVEQYLM